MPCSSPDPYELLAKYYDVGHDTFDADTPLYDALARRTSFPVLELGAGTGRLAHALAAHGHAVTGIDASSAMLAIARAKPVPSKGSVAFVCDDMRHPSVSGQFGLIVCAIDTFLHLLTTDDQVLTLRAARGLLAPGGLIVLDLPGPAGDWGDWEPGARPLVLDWIAEQTGAQVCRYSTFRADLSTQTRHVIEAIDEIGRDGLMRRCIVEYDLRFVFPAEAELLIRVAGLRLYARYGDYDLAPFDDGSPRMIVLAERDPGLP